LLSDYGKTLSQLRTRVLLLIDDPGGDRFTTASIWEAINDAMLDLALDTQLIKEKLTIKLLADQHLYEIHERIAAGGTLRPYGFPVRIGYNLTTDSAIKPISTAMYDLARIGFNESSGPTAWRTDIFSYGEVAFFPIPAADGSTIPALTGNVEVTYIALPTKMTSGTSTPDTLQAQYHEAIAVRAAELLLDEGNAEDLMFADGFEADYERWTQRIVGDQYRGMTRYDSVRPM
jgi:hypothetical protein